MGQAEGELYDHRPVQIAVGAQGGDQQAGVAAAHVDDVTKCAPGVSSSYSGRGYAELPGPGGAAFLLDLDSAA